MSEVAFPSSSIAPKRSAGGIETRISNLDWCALGGELDARGYALPGKLLGAQDCRDLVEAYDQEALYRSRVVMKRHNFGLGEYRYFSYPLPDLIGRLRAAAYGFLAPLANRWAERMKQDVRYPGDLESFLAVCHAQEQVRTTTACTRIFTAPRPFRFNWRSC